ncbi:MAG: EamA family transporter [Alphaproteobacteria bacterium]
MDGIVVAAALASAFLHAAWNAAIKAAPDPRSAMAAAVVASGAVAVPLLFFLPMPAPASWPWLAASAVFNLFAMLALARGYATGAGFGLVYPLARATSPLLVTLFGGVIFGEHLGTLGLVGVALVSAGVALFAGGDGRRHPLAIACALAAGIFTAAYILADAQGVRASASMLGYGLVVSVVNAIVFGTVHRLRGGGPILAALRANPMVALFVPAASNASYPLILWVWSLAPVAVGAALRDTSVVFAALIAVVVLKERVTARRAAAIALVAAGAAALRFA